MTNDDLKQIDQLFTKRFSVMEKSFDEKLSKNKDEIIDEVIDDVVGFMEKNLFPKLERMAEKSDIERIDRRVDRLAVDVGGHEVRIKDIEFVPVIAHQLKLKKKK